MIAFSNFLIEERDNPVKGSTDTANKIWTELGITIEDRRVRKKKKMSGEHAEDVGLGVVEKLRQCMFQALNRLELEAETNFTDIRDLNDALDF